MIVYGSATQLKMENVKLKIVESDASAAGGRESELSEWQRSTDAKAFHRRRQMSGTATGICWRK